MSRGWVFQERAASRRVIAFGRDQVFWDCSEVLESDLLPGHPIYMGSYVGNTKEEYPEEKTVPKAISPGVPQSFYSLEHMFRTWQSLVQRYSACVFTFNKDRPVAILGVAKMMSIALRAQPMAISSVYWAGLWLREMPWDWQFTWHPARPGLRKNCYAPSWSWLSIDGPVIWHHYHDEKDELEEYGTRTSKLASIAWYHDETTGDDSTFHEVSADLKMWCNLYILHVEDHPYLKLDCEDIEADDLYFLPLEYYELEFWQLNGILVQPTENVLGTYNRCGTVGFSGRASFQPEHTKDFLNLPGPDKREGNRQMLHQVGGTVAPTDFAHEEYDSELGYSICLV